MNAELKEAQEQLIALIAEREHIEKTIPELEKQLTKLKQRISDLNPSISRKHEKGLIKKTELQVLELSSPVFYDLCSLQNQLNPLIYRIIDVTDKWIIIKRDGEWQDNTTEYNVKNGRIKGARSSEGAIDVVKALAVWEQHKASNGGDV
ncbi:MAG: hypothetical protein RL755_52 [Pseudomonadota bacterium]|jgi:hypothetical protein